MSLLDMDYTQCQKCLEHLMILTCIVMIPSKHCFHKWQSVHKNCMGPVATLLFVIICVFYLWMILIVISSNLSGKLQKWKYIHEKESCLKTSNFFLNCRIWFAILLTTSIFWLLFRVVSFYSCKLRSFLLARRAGTLPVSTSHMHDGANCCSKICSRVSYADWVLIMQLGCNMDPLTYKLFLESFCRQTGIKDTVKPSKIIDKIYYSPVWFLRSTVDA